MEGRQYRTTLETAFSEKDLETPLENPMLLLSYFESSHFALLHINNRGLHIYAALSLIVQSLSSFKLQNSTSVMRPCTHCSRCDTTNPGGVIDAEFLHVPSLPLYWA